jgi:hypothetical protein
MGWLPVLMAGGAAYILYQDDHPILFVFAVVSAIGCIWSWGIMHNYATDAARHRSSYRGDFNDITEAEAAAVPDWIAKINLGFSFVALGLLVTAIVLEIEIVTITPQS